MLKIEYISSIFRNALPYVRKSFDKKNKIKKTNALLN